MNKNNFPAESHRPRSGPPAALLSAVALIAFLVGAAAAMGAPGRGAPRPAAADAPDAGARYLRWAVATHRTATRSVLSTRPDDRFVCSPTAPPPREHTTQADSRASGG